MKKKIKPILDEEGDEEERWIDRVEMGAMEMGELIEQRIEQGANKKETNRLIDEFNSKFSRIYNHVK